MRAAPGGSLGGDYHGDPKGSLLKRSSDLNCSDEGRPWRQPTTHVDFGPHSGVKVDISARPLPPSSPAVEI